MAPGSPQTSHQIDQPDPAVSGKSASSPSIPIFGQTMHHPVRAASQAARRPAEFRGDRSGFRKTARIDLQRFAATGEAPGSLAVPGLKQPGSINQSASSDFRVDGWEEARERANSNAVDFTIRAFRAGAIAESEPALRFDCSLRDYEKAAPDCYTSGIGVKAWSPSFKAAALPPNAPIRTAWSAKQRELASS